MIQIITDSAADLPDELVKKHGLRIVPLTVTIDGVEYREGIDITTEEFNKKMVSSKTLPRTSQPAATSFASAFRELATKGELICITISSKLSGTYQSACLAREMSGCDVAVFDSQAATLGQGLQVIKAAELAQKGWSRNSIIEELKRYRNSMNIYILLYTLENIVKGGRLSRFQGALSKILNIKVLLTGVEGKVVMLERIHGRKKALHRLLERIAEKLQGAHNCSRRFGISHCQNPADSEFLKEEIEKRFPSSEVIINEMGPTISTYAGAGGLVVSF